MFEKQNNDKYWKNMRIEKPIDFQDYFDQVRRKQKVFEYDGVCDRVLTKFREG